MKISQYAKAIVYIALAAAAVLSTSSDWSTVTILNAALAAAGVVPVYWVTKEKYLKAVSAAVVACLQALLILLGPGLGLGDVSPQAWIGIVIAALAAAGVAIVPNAPLLDAGTAESASAGLITTVPATTAQPPVAADATVAYEAKHALTTPDSGVPPAV